MELKWKQIYVWACVLAIVFCSVVGYLGLSLDRGELSIGRQVLQLMYTFEEPSDLAEQYAKLKGLLTEEAWDTLNIDNELRVVNTYYKFGAKSSKVKIVYETSGLILYTLENENIDPNRLWAFYYDTLGKKVGNIREYKLTQEEHWKGGVP